MSTPAYELKHAQNLVITAQTFAIIAMVMLTVAIITKGGFSIGSTVISADLTWQQKVHNTGLVLNELLPAFWFLEAVNHLRRALSTFGNSEFFSNEAARHVANAGSSAIYATIAVMLITPNLLLWVNQQGGFDVRIEPEYIGMLAFAVFVSAVGRILAAATYIKTENDAFV